MCFLIPKILFEQHLRGVSQTDGKEDLNVFLKGKSFGCAVGLFVRLLAFKKMIRGFGGGRPPNKTHAKRHTPVASALFDRREQRKTVRQSADAMQCFLPGAGNGRQKALPEKGGREKPFSL